MTDEAKALVDPVGEWLQVCTDGRVSSHTITMLNAFRRWYDDQYADLIETQAREIERLREACEKIKAAAIATAKIRLVKRERELEVCGSNMSRAKMKCRANEAAILLNELRALDVAAIVGDSHD